MADGVKAKSNRLDPEPEPNPVRVMWALIGGVVGGSAVLFLQTGHLALKPVTMTFEQFAGILLTSVAVLVTVFGAILAILAFWGFSQLRKDVANQAIEAAKGQVDQLIQNEIKSPEFERRVRNRVDEITLGNSVKDKDLDTDSENDGGNDAQS